MIKGLSIKDVRSQGKGLSSAGILRTRGRGSSDANVHTFWLIKVMIFRNLWCVRTDKGGWLSADIFRTRKRRGQFFAILCGRLLWTVPNQNLTMRSN